MSYSYVRDIWEKATREGGGGVWHILREKYVHANRAGYAQIESVPGAKARRAAAKEAHRVAKESAFDAGTSVLIGLGKLLLVPNALGLHPVYRLRGVTTLRYWDCPSTRTFCGFPGMDEFYRLRDYEALEDDLFPVEVRQDAEIAHREAVGFP